MHHNGKILNTWIWSKILEILRFRTKQPCQQTCKANKTNRLIWTNFFLFLTGPINWFLSWRIWQPIARLSYGAYLIHPMVMIWYYGAHQYLIFSHDYTMVSARSFSKPSEHLSDQKDLSNALTWCGGISGLSVPGKYVPDLCWSDHRKSRGWGTLYEIRKHRFWTVVSADQDTPWQTTSMPMPQPCGLNNAFEAGPWESRVLNLQTPRIHQHTFYPGTRIAFHCTVMPTRQFYTLLKWGRGWMFFPSRRQWLNDDEIYTALSVGTAL